jgi:hypothetical protein
MNTRFSVFNKFNIFCQKLHQCGKNFIEQCDCVFYCSDMLVSARFQHKAHSCFSFFFGCPYFILASFISPFLLSRSLLAMRCTGIKFIILLICTVWMWRQAFSKTSTWINTSVIWKKFGVLGKCRGTCCNKLGCYSAVSRYSLTGPQLQHSPDTPVQSNIGMWTCPNPRRIHKREAKKINGPVTACNRLHFQREFDYPDNIPPKRRLSPTRSHCVKTQKTNFDRFAVVRTCNIRQ